MISTSKADGFINNLIGLCLTYGFNHNDMKEFKKYLNTHKFINNKCTECDFSLNEFRYNITNGIIVKDRGYIHLSCNERIIKKLLE